MGSLRETYEAMHAVLRGEQSCAEAAPLLGVDPDRLAIYQGFVQGHITGILATQYPRVNTMLTEAAWERLTGAFFTAHPASDWDVNDAAAPFPEFLSARLGDMEELTLSHVAMARFESAQWTAYSDPTRIPRPEEVTARVINPTLIILELPCPIINLVLSIDRGEAPSAPWPDAAEGAERVLLFRQPDRETSAFWRADNQLILALATVDQGLTSETAADTFGCGQEVIEAALARADTIGLCIGPAHIQGG